MRVDIHLSSKSGEVDIRATTMTSHLRWRQPVLAAAAFLGSARLGAQVHTKFSTGPRKE